MSKDFQEEQRTRNYTYTLTIQQAEFLQTLMACFMSFVENRAEQLKVLVNEDGKLEDEAADEGYELLDTAEVCNSLFEGMIAQTTYYKEKLEFDCSINDDE